jgi:hypothetical protein
MSLNKPSTSTRIVLKTIILLFFVICLPGLAQAQWEPTYTGSNDIHNTNSGNVGIGTGTTSPADKLEVAGNIRLQDNTASYLIKRADAVLPLFKITRSDDSQAGLLRTNGWGNFTVDRGFGIGYDLSGAQFAAGLYVNGNIGIGTTTPFTRLTATGGSQSPLGNGFDGLLQLTTGTGAQTDEKLAIGIVDGSSGYSWLQAYKAGISTRALSLQPLGGNVGIGTSNPAESLEVNGNIRLSNNGFITSTAGHLLMSGATYTYLRAGTDVRIADNSNANVLVAAGGGNVGIGTFSPDANYKLDVEGSVKVSGNIAAKYQDVAEWVMTSKDLPVASVVVLDSNHSNQVTTSIKGYDTRVAGVVSGKPGLVLGEGGAGKAMIATVGRVKVKVDATRQPIHVGDLLVTGTLEGTAMKSVPVNIGGVAMHRPGTLIGKALEPLEKGTGEILVLLSLQ